MAIIVYGSPRSTLELLCLVGKLSELSHFSHLGPPLLYRKSPFIEPEKMSFFGQLKNVKQLYIIANLKNSGKTQGRALFRDTKIPRRRIVADGRWKISRIVGKFALGPDFLSKIQDNIGVFFSSRKRKIAGDIFHLYQISVKI